MLCYIQATKFLRPILIMRVSTYLSRSFLILGLTSLAYAASSWSFDDASLSVQSKKAGVGSAIKEKYAHGQLVI